MSREKGFFINVLADYIAEKETSSVDNIDWKEIRKISRSHEVTGIIFYQCKKFIPQEIKASFEREYYLSLYYYKKREEEYNKISKAFSIQHLPFFQVKGLSIARYYPTPELRTMGDMDIFIHSEDRDKADAIMQEMNYRKTTYWDNKEMGFKKDNIHFEIHDHMIYEQNINNEALELFFSDYWPYVENGVLDASYHLLYLFLHLRKHLLNVGVGFRMFLDICLMSKNEEKIDWTWVRDRLEELGMYTFSRTCYSFIHKWFKVQSPFIEKDINTDFFEKATNTIFTNGVFGYNNEKNYYNEVINAARKGTHHKCNIIKHYFNQVFPPYELMKNNKYYHFIYGKSWLLPCAWIYRLYRAAHMLRHGKKTIVLHPISLEQYKERDMYLKSWGL